MSDKEQHKLKHCNMYRSLRLLTIDFVVHKKIDISKVSIEELLKWSANQAARPTEEIDDQTA